MDTDADIDITGSAYADDDRSASAGTAVERRAPSCARVEEPCDLVTVPARQGLEAVDIIRRGARPAAAVGPVLHDGTCDTLGFLVPPGTAAAWDVPGSACTETNGRGLRIAGLPVEPPVTGSGWLLPPDSRRGHRPGPAARAPSARRPG